MFKIINKVSTISSSYIRNLIKFNVLSKNYSIKNSNNKLNKINSFDSLKSLNKPSKYKFSTSTELNQQQNIEKEICNIKPYNIN